MGIENKFIDDALLKNRLKEFVSKKLAFAGVGSVEVKKTPMVTKINVEVLIPGKVIGKRGRTIRELTEIIKNKFNIETPQINVVEVTDIYTNSKLVAEKAARFIEMKRSYRHVVHVLIDEIMKRDVVAGVEIRIAGKLAGKGGRSKAFRANKGFVPKSGEPARMVRISHACALTPYGIIGIKVSIAMKDQILPAKEKKKGNAGQSNNAEMVV